MTKDCERVQMENHQVCWLNTGIYRLMADDNEGSRKNVVAEREGFEPPIRLPVCRISSAVRSTTLPPLQVFVR